MFGFGRSKKIKKNELNNNHWGRIFARVQKHELDEIRAHDKFVKWFKDGELDGDDPTEAKASFTFARVKILLALLYANTPMGRVSPNPKGAGSEQSFAPIVAAGLIPSLSEAKREFAATIEELVRYSYRESNIGIHNEAALFEAAVRGLGITKTSFDSVRGIDRVDCVRRHEVYFDPEARYCLEQGDYVIQTSVMGVEKARRFFEKYGVNAKDIQPNYSFQAAKDIASTWLSKQNEEDADADLFKFHEIWLKEGDQARSLMYRNAIDNEWIGDKIPWPFEIDYDDFPYEILTFAQQFSHVKDAFSALHTIKGVSRMYAEMVEAMFKKGRRSVCRKILYDPDRLDEDAVQLLKNTRDLEWIAVKAKEGKINDAYTVVELNMENDVTGEMAGMAKAIGDESYGTDEMQRGGLAGGRMSAEEASIRDENSKLRSNDMQRIVDRWQDRQYRHRIMICRQLTSPETVAMVAGEIGAILWGLHAGNARDLTAEYSIQVAAGSTGARAKEKRRESLMAEFDTGMAINQQAMGLPVVDLVSLHEQIALENGSLEPKQFVNQEMKALYLSGQLLMPPAQEDPNAQGQPVEGMQDPGDQYA
jgi:hypothetical protein